VRRLYMALGRKIRADDGTTFRKIHFIVCDNWGLSQGVDSEEFLRSAHLGCPAILFYVIGYSQLFLGDKRVVNVGSD
jgi:hypothetical protein